MFRFSYPSSTLAHHRLQNCASSVKHIHHCLLLHYAVSSFNRPIINSLRIFQTCNRPTIDLLPDSHDRPIVDSFPDFNNSNSFDSSSRFVRLENHAEFGYLTPFDLTPLDLWRSAFTGSIESARSQPILLLMQQPRLLRLLRLLKAFQRSRSVCCCTVLQRVNPSGCSPSFVVVGIAATISDQHVLTIRGFCVLAMVS